MTPGRQPVGTPSEAMDTSRLEIFADGVFGIAATLLIVRVAVDAPGGALGKALLHAWPQYVAYAVSFLMIGIWWVNHHAFMKVIERVDRTFLFANIALLACIAFVPFPTGLVAKHFHDNGLQAAVIIYGLTLTSTAICMSFLWFYAAIGRRLIVGTTKQSVVNGISRYVAPGPFGTGLATLIAIWSPYTTLALIAASACFYVVGGSPTKLFAKEPRGQSRSDGSPTSACQPSTPRSSIEGSDH